MMLLGFGADTTTEDENLNLHISELFPVRVFVRAQQIEVLVFDAPPLNQLNGCYWLSYLHAPTLSSDVLLLCLDTEDC